MRAQIVDNHIIGIGDVTGEGTYQLPAELPAGFEDNYDLYDAILEGDLVTELQLVRTPIEESEIVRISELWQVQFRDYKQFREWLKNAYTDFNSLDTAEKRVIAENFATSSENIDSVLSFEERVNAGKEFDTLSQQSRQARFDYAKSYLYNALERQDGDNVVGTILQKGLRELYVVYGQEGSMKANYKGEFDRVGLFDFVFGTPEGAEEFGYRMIDVISTPKYDKTPQQIVDRCFDILDNGNY